MRIPILILAGLVIFRAWLFLNYYLVRDVYFYSDDAIYAILAGRLLRGDLWTGFHPIWNPGFPLITIPFYLITQSFEKAQIIVSMVSATLLPLAMFWTLKRFSIRLALVSAFLIVFAAGLQRFVTSEGISEPFFILLMWVSVSFGWLYLTTERLRYVILSGIFFGLTYLTRTDIVGIFAAFFLIVLIKAFKKVKTRKQAVSALGKIVIFLGAFWLVNLPYISVVSAQVGGFTLSGKYAMVGSYYPFQINKTGSTFMQDVDSVDYPNFKSVYFDKYKTVSYVYQEFRKGSIFHFARDTFQGILKIFYTDSKNFFSGIGIWLAATGLILGVLDRRLRRFTTYLLLLWLSEILWITFFMAPLSRYLSFSYPFFFCMQAVAITLISLKGGNWICKIFQVKKDYINILSTGLVLMFLGLFVFQNFKVMDFYNPKPDKRNLSNKKIGEWIKSQDIRVIGARFEAIGYYGNAKTIYIPAAKPYEIVDYMKRWGVEYFFIHPSEAGDDYVRPITKPDFSHPDLELVKIFEDGTLTWKVNLTPEEREGNLRK